MPEIKNTFLSGKMNKDLDERLIPKGEYRDALNLDLSTSESDDVGSLQNAYGNTIQSTISTNINNPKCVGSIADKENDKIYWFIAGDKSELLTNGELTGSSAKGWTGEAVNGVLDTGWTAGAGNVAASSAATSTKFIHDGDITFTVGRRYTLTYTIRGYSAGGLKALIVDADGDNATFTTRSANGTYTETVQLTDNTNLSANFNKLYFEPTAAFTGTIESVSLIEEAVDAIMEYDFATGAEAKVLIDAREYDSRVLKFDQDTLITGINILDGLLFFTDGVYEPKKISIKDCIQGSSALTDFTTTTQLNVNGVNEGLIQEKDITVVKRYPVSAPDMNLSEDVRGNNTVIETSCTTPVNTTYNSFSHLAKASTGEAYENLNGWLYGTIYQNPRYTQNYNRGLVTLSCTSTVNGLTLTAGSDAEAAGVKVGMIVAGTGQPGGPLRTDGIQASQITTVSGSTSATIGAAFASSFVEPGYVITDHTDIPSGTTVVSISTSTVVLSVAATGSSQQATVFTKPQPITVTAVSGTTITMSTTAVVAATATFTFTSPNGEGSYIQLDPGGAQFLASSLVPFTRSKPSLSQVGLQANDFKPDGFQAIDLVGSASTDFNKSSYNWWNSLQAVNSCYCFDANGNVINGDYTVNIDKLTDRVYFDGGFTDLLDDAAHSDYWKVGQNFTLGDDYMFNNVSFWTYIDAEGEKVKPVGVSSDPLALSDGSILKDDPTSFLDQNAQTQYNALNVVNPADNSTANFATGWTASSSTYVGAANGSAGATALRLVDNVANNIIDGFKYEVRATFTVTQGSGSTTQSDCGWGDGTSTPQNGIPTSHTQTSFHLGTEGFRLPPNAGVGTYILGGVVDASVASGVVADFKIFKRDNVKVTVSNIQVTPLVSNEVKIQPLVFSPRPDYEVGDIIEMTCTTKTPNGSDVKVKVELIEEIQEDVASSPGHNLTGPFANTWATAHVAGSDVIDQDFSSSSNWTLTNTSITSGVLRKTAGSAGTAIYTATDLTAETYYQVEYEVSASSTVDQTVSTERVYLFDMAREDGSGADHHVLLNQNVGTYKFTFKTGGDSGTTKNLKLGFDSNTVVDITSIKVRPVTQTTVTTGEYGDNGSRKIFNAKIKTINNNMLTISESDRRFWDCSLEQRESFYELLFPRFAYRWKYKNGEYSAISAFTNAAFIPGDEFDFDYKHAYNLAMVNRVRRVELKNFEHVPKNVVELDIVYKESNSTNIYVLRTIKDLDDWKADVTDKSVVITKNQIKSAIESNQMLRPYDNVPKYAKSQEIVANRLVYGNYTHQYDINTTNEPTPSFAGVVSNLVPENTVDKSIKSHRDYQIGAAWLDKYGRQTTVFTSKDALINIDGNSSKDANHFNTKITNTPPDWATHYKYYVKDSAGEFYNLALDRFYQGEGEEHVWLSFPSKDRNKVIIDDYLVLKKTHEGNTFVDYIKYKIIDIKNEAPDYIKRTRASVGGRIMNVNNYTTGTTGSAFTTPQGLHFFTQSTYGGGTGSFPLVGRSTFKVRGDVVAEQPALEEALLDSQFQRYIKLGKKDLSGGDITVSEYYEVSSVNRTADSNGAFNTADSNYEFILTKPIGPDAAFIGIAPSTSDAPAIEARGLFFEYFRTEENLEGAEFVGRFFVKILKDGVFDTEIASKGSEADGNYIVKTSQNTHWAHVYDTKIDEHPDYDSTNHPTGTDRDITLLSQYMFNFSLAGGTFDFVSSGGNGAAPQVYLTGNGDGVYVGDGTSSKNAADFWADTSSEYLNGTLGHQWYGEQYNLPSLSDYKLRTRVSNWATPLAVNSLQNNTPVTTQFNSNAAATRLSNPYCQNWAGTHNKDDYHGGNGDQKFCIDQAWCWGWGDNNLHYPGQIKENTHLGSGFVIGRNYCTFRFINFGTHQNAGGDLDDDFNDFIQTSNTSNVNANTTANFFESNYDLYVALTTPKTKFRWSNDPTGTVYTVIETKEKFVRNYHDNKINLNVQGSDKDDGWNEAYLSDPSRENMGYRIHLTLDKPIVWSPTSNTYVIDDAGTVQTPLSALTSTTTGSTSSIEIVENIPGEKTFTSDNPAVFEVEPRERADLNLFYETPKARMLLKNGMKIEALNNDNVNDSGFGPNQNFNSGGVSYPGNYQGLGTTGAYAPAGTTTPAIVADSTITIDSTHNINEFTIPASATASPLPKGVTIRITSTDANGYNEFFREFLLPETVTNGVETKITIPHDSLDWHNCWSFGNGVESDRVRDDYNAVMLDKGPRVSTTLDEPYAEENRKSDLIYSGIYNSQSGTNRLNQFIMAEKITKSLNPEYGSIQKLFTRNYDLLAFCEDKVLRILASKDALFNADGNMQLTATNKVLGQAVPFAGEFGISKNPESFAHYGYRVYFSDKNRGTVLRLSQDGLTPISSYGMSNYFKTKFAKADTVLGSYDEDKDIYNITLDNSTISFTEKVNGWTSFKSFLPESGVSVNGVYYTFKNGDIWKHNVNDIRNNFYSTQYDSSVKFIFNDQPDVIKSFNTLNYEGTQSREYEAKAGEEDQIIKKGWYTSSVESDKQSGQVPQFKEKEGKWYNNIVGVDSDETNIDTSEFTSQGLGFVTAVGRGSHDDYKTLTITAKYPQSVPTVNLVGAKSATGLNGSIVAFNTPSSLDNGTAAYTEDSTYDSVTGWEMQSATQARWEATDSSVTVNNYFLTNWATDLVSGNTYFISADLTDVNGANLASGGPAVEIDSTNMTNFDASTMALTSGTSGKIFTSFTYNPTSTTGDFGVLIGKHNDTSGTLSNLSIVNTTNQLDNVKFTVNTSATDRASTDTTITAQKVESTTFTQSVTFYIHSQIVRGIKYGLTAAHFTATSSSNITNVTLADLGTAGYHDNIVKVTGTVEYTSADLFPTENVDLFIQITANAGAPAIAIDQ